MDISVTIDVDGVELDPEQEIVVEAYEELVETFIRKNSDYGSSYVRSAVIQCYYKHGEVTDDLLLECIAQQVFVRMLDKQSRFQELMFDSDTEDGEPRVEDEGLDDTLLDWANYCVMLAAQVRMYADDDIEFASQYADVVDDAGVNVSSDEMLSALREAQLDNKSPEAIAESMAAKINGDEE